MSSVEADFTKADSQNLPTIDLLSIMTFFNENKEYLGAEMKGIKLERSGRQEYGDNAIGYVQLKRSDSNCTVKSRITPEHSVTKKPYTVSCVINEALGHIVKVECEDCKACKGGCKHSVALLMWLHRRSEEPSPTSIVSYWQKPKMSQIGSSLKFILAKDIGKTNSGHLHESGRTKQNKAIFDQFNDYCLSNGIENQLSRYSSESCFEHLSVHTLFCEFKILYKKSERSYANFIEFCTEKMGDVHEVLESRGQSNSAIWYELRYGRVTASTVYTASRCNTDGSLVEIIFGAKLFESAAMKRGKEVEGGVIGILKSKGIPIKECGLFLTKQHPMLGASPDGINDTHVIEIKSPFKESTMTNYINKDGITAKCMAQIQLQMYICNRKKALFVVAEPNFEQTRNIIIKEVDFDSDLCKKLISEAEKCWSIYIYPKLNQ